MTYIPAWKKQKVIEWDNMPRLERIPIAQLRQELGLRKISINKIITEGRQDIPRIQQRAITEYRQIQKQDEDAQLNLASITPQEIADFKRLLYQIGMGQRASAKDRELCGKMLGVLIEKSEHKVKVELSADEITKRNLEAERQLRDEGY